MNISDFHTVKAHSKARKMPLFSPDGKKSEHYIMVLGRDSSQARAGMADGKRSALEGGDVTEAIDLLHASMIDSWSFPEECSLENKLDLLKNAPSIGDSVDSFSCKHENFTKK